MKTFLKRLAGVPLALIGKTPATVVGSIKTTFTAFNGIVNIICDLLHAYIQQVHILADACWLFPEEFRAKYGIDQPQQQSAKRSDLFKLNKPDK